MYNMLGETTFLKGMERYLKENSYQPVEEKDLFGALGQQALDDGLSLPEDFDTMMSQWTRQAGYPIITVTRHYDDEGTVTISQVNKRSSDFLSVAVLLYKRNSQISFLLKFLSYTHV
jgi:aminopeptidase N